MKQDTLSTSVRSWTVFNALCIAILIFQIIDTAFDGGRRSYNLAEAAMLGARWTSIVAQTLLLMLINTIIIITTFLTKLREIRWDLEQQRALLDRLVVRELQAARPPSVGGHRESALDRLEKHGPLRNSHEDNHPYNYRGKKYISRPDYSVEDLVDGELRTWRNLQDFHQWVDDVIKAERSRSG
jgi:hypothetical protein